MKNKFPPFSITALTILFAIHPAFGQFYIATNGSDNNPGTLGAPFATFGKAQTAMRSGKTKITYVRAGNYSIPGSHNGVYNMTFNLTLAEADSNETWSYYPSDGYNSAIIDGGSTSPTTGNDGVISIENCSGLTWNGIQIKNFQWNAIVTYAAPHTTIINSIFHDGYYNGSQKSNAGAILGINSPSFMISNNVVYNMAYFGIEAYTGTPGGLNQTTIQNNIVYNVMSGILNGSPVTDGGAIYLQDIHEGSSNIKVQNNFIRDYGIATNGSKGIYFDDGTSNAVATGNIVTGKGQYAIQYHAGSNVTVTGNIIDIGSSGNQAIFLYQPNGGSNPMTGNTFTNNIVVASGGPGNGYMAYNNPPNPCSIHDNTYYNYNGSSVKSSGNGGSGSDSNPVYQNPKFCGPVYNIAPGSPVFNSPVNFPPQPASNGTPGYWGPPGYVIPQTGTLPSYPSSPCSIGTGIYGTIQSGIRIEVYPNPCTGNITLFMTDAHTGDYNFRVTDITGRAIYNHQIFLSAGTEENITLPLENLRGGAYIISVENENTVTRTKLIKK